MSSDTFDGWHMVEDSLPDYDHDCIVELRGGEIWIAHHNSSEIKLHGQAKGWVSFGYALDMENRVRQWCAFPVPPEAKDE